MNFTFSSIIYLLFIYTYIFKVSAEYEIKYHHSLFDYGIARNKANAFLNFDKNSPKSKSNDKSKSNAGIFEELQADDLQRECLEERCSFEEVKEVYNHDIKKSENQWYKFTNKCKYGEEHEKCNNRQTKVCVNKWQSLQCICLEGFTGEKCDENEDECSKKDRKAVEYCENNDANSYCVDTFGSFTCECVEGYEKNNSGKCKNINECSQKSLNNCQQNCIDTEGSFICSCNSGYILNSDGHTCKDINECSDGTHSCSENSDCVNNDGSYECVCHNGFVAISNKDNRICNDVDECLDEKLCKPFGVCRNIPGSFKCDCDVGFENGKDGLCFDVKGLGRHGLGPVTVRSCSWFGPDLDAQSFPYRMPKTKRQLRSQLSQY